MDSSNLLLQASFEGSVPSLEQLLQEDPLVLDRYTILNTLNDTPLHVAAMLGHIDFVKEILTRKPELAIELNSQNSSPLHLASAKGYVEIVKELILVQPDMCLARDRNELNPLHLAAIKGKVDVLKELLGVRVDAARATVRRGETILHLCVKHSKLEALKLLVQTLSDDEFVNSKDDAGLNILDVAVKEKQIEIIKFLTLNTLIEVNELNEDDARAMGIVAGTERLEENHTKIFLTGDSTSKALGPVENNIFNELESLLAKIKAGVSERKGNTSVLQNLKSYLEDIFLELTIIVLGVLRLKVMAKTVIDTIYNYIRLIIKGIRELMTVVTLSA